MKIITKILIIFLVIPLFPHTTLAATRYQQVMFNNVEKTADIVYGFGSSLPTLIPRQSTTVQLKMDMYQPVGDTATNRIAIIWVHGGSFYFGDKQDFAGTATDFAKRGYATFSINYRMTDHSVTPGSNEITTVAQAVKHDILAAVRFVRSHASEYGIDPNRIVIGGTSAGAWSSLYAAFDTANVGSNGNPGVSSRVSAVISLSGGMRSEDLNLITQGEPPVIFIHGNQDGVVPLSLPQGVYDRARSVNIPAEIHVYQGGHDIFPEGFVKIREFLYAQLVSANASASPLPSSLPGDLNSDGNVNLADYNKLVSGYGTTYNLSNYNQLIAHYGR